MIRYTQWGSQIDLPPKEATSCLLLHSSQERSKICWCKIFDAIGVCTTTSQVTSSSSAYSLIAFHLPSDSFLSSYSGHGHGKVVHLDQFTYTYRVTESSSKSCWIFQYLLLNMFSPNLGCSAGQASWHCPAIAYWSDVKILGPFLLQKTHSAYIRGVFWAPDSGCQILLLPNMESANLHAKLAKITATLKIQNLNKST